MAKQIIEEKRVEKFEENLIGVFGTIKTKTSRQKFKNKVKK